MKRIKKAGPIVLVSLLIALGLVYYKSYHISHTSKSMTLDSSIQYTYYLAIEVNPDYTKATKLFYFDSLERAMDFWQKGLCIGFVFGQLSEDLRGMTGATAKQVLVTPAYAKKVRQKVNARIKPKHRYRLTDLRIEIVNDF